MQAFTPEYLADPHCAHCSKPLDGPDLKAELERGKEYPFCPRCREAADARSRVLIKRAEAKMKISFWDDQMQKAETQGFVDATENP